MFQYSTKENVFRKYRPRYLCIVFFGYFACMIFLGEILEVSVLFIVLIPVFFISLAFGLRGGLPAGILSMPVNMLFYVVLGFPEFTIESAVVVEILGIIIGLLTGLMTEYHNNFYSQLEGDHKHSEELQHKIQDKEILIQEIHHRVKNNLTLILSLIQLQEDSSHSEELKNIIHIVSQRIRAIASVHDHIYSYETNTSVNLQQHLPSLCRAIIDSYQVPDLIFQEDLQFSMGISVQKATSLSLIILEIITNSCKYAFLPEQEEPRIFLHGRDVDKELVLIISDNGQSKQEKEQKSNTPGGLGSVIIAALVKQMRATLLMNTEKGYEYVIKIPRSLLKMTADQHKESTLQTLDT